MNLQLIARFAIREASGLNFVAVALFWSAGRFDWWSAWAILAITSGWSLATAIVIVSCYPDLLAERLRLRKSAKRWDTAILSLHGILQLAMYVEAGLDQRYEWTNGLPLSVQISAFTVCIVGYGSIVWATASNAFFSQNVRNQTNHGHKVATGGPYRYVRHPAYAGGILTEVFMPILLAPWWAIIIDLVDGLIMILRTALEDRTLKTELPGYVDYALKVRSRLVPGI